MAKIGKVRLLEEELNQTKSQVLDFRDRINALEEREEILQKSFAEIASLHTLSEKINSTYDLDTILNTLLDVSKEVLDYKSAALLLWENNQDYRVAIKRNVSKNQIKKIDFQIEQGLFDWAIEQRKPTIIPDLSTRYIKTKKSYILAPLIVQDAILGVLYLETTADDLVITQQHFQMISLLTNQAAIAALNARLYQKLWEKTAAVTSAKNFLEGVLASMSDAIMVFDLEGTLIRTNEKAQFFFAMAADGKTIDEVLPRKEVAFFKRLLKKTTQSKKVVIKQIELNLNGKHYILEVILSPMKDVRGKKKGVIAVFRDLTERQELDKMRRIDQIKSELISNISHELRTPLTSIKACGETLLDNLEEPDADLQRELIQIICDQSNKLNLTISNFLELALLTSKERTFAKKRTTPQALVERVLESSDLSNAVIATCFEDNLPAIMVDEFEVTLALVNLLHNALNFSPDKKGVRLEIARKRINRIDYCCFKVIDHGIGIDKDQIPRLTEKFYRVDSSFTAEVGGAGIGLTVANEIINVHKGKLVIESTPGKGSIFTLCIQIRQ